MREKANFVLNLWEPVIVFLVSVLLILSLVTDIPSTFLFISAIICELIVVLIEVFLFFIYKKLFKFLYFLYFIIEVILTFLVNARFPFYGMVVIVGFSFLKAFLRIRYIKEIYIPKEFDYYLKLFHISIKKKKKKKATIKKKTTRTAPKKKTVLANELVSSKKIKI